MKAYTHANLRTLSELKRGDGKRRNKFRNAWIMLDLMPFLQWIIWRKWMFCGLCLNFPQSIHLHYYFHQWYVDVGTKKVNSWKTNNKYGKNSPVPLLLSLIVHNNHIQITLYSSFGSTFTFLSSSTRLGCLEQTNKHTHMQAQTHSNVENLKNFSSFCFARFCDAENLFKWESLWMMWQRCDSSCLHW